MSVEHVKVRLKLWCDEWFNQKERHVVGKCQGCEGHSEEEVKRMLGVILDRLYKTEWKKDLSVSSDMNAESYFTQMKDLLYDTKLEQATWLTDIWRQNFTAHVDDEHGMHHRNGKHKNRTCQRHG